MTLTNALVTILVAIVGSGGLWAFIDKQVEKKKHDSAKKLDKLIDTVEELKNDIKLNGNVTKALARTQLNNMSESFMDLGYIPRKDFVAFRTLGDAYLEANANTEVEDKYRYIIDNLEVQ